MKKFSKLFQRLGRGRPDANGRDLDSDASREESPDVHQLTSRRALGELKRLPRNGLSRIVADAHHPPCDSCAAIDFPRLLSWQPGQPRPWIPLAHTLADSECPYCTFFQAMVGALPDETRKFTPYLRIRQAFERLGIGEKHGLGSAVLFEVTTKSKSLPWGYIVRAVDADNDNDWAGYRESATPALRGRLVAPKLDPALPRMWIDFCKANHLSTCCRSTGPPIRALQLIDCNLQDVVPVSDISGQHVDYVTLSYVWGKTDGEPEGEPEQHHGLPEVLPPLIADVMSMTKSLGYRYLWVDRYCLLQQDAAEKRRQLDLMGDIYARSALTLVIAAGEGVSDGIPGMSVPREEQLSLQTETGVFTTSLIRPDVEVAGSKWASRGWTFQEGLLSRRQLVFTPSQIYFQCQSLHCHESISFPLATSPALNLGRVFPMTGAGSRPADFKAQINGYISRDFTFFEDRLDGFRGVLQRYAQMEPAVDNFLGLPLFHAKEFKDVTTLVSKTDRLAVGLGWRPDALNDGRNYAHPLYLLDTHPSWTWLAWKARPNHGNIAFNFYQVGDQAPLVDAATAAPGLEISIGLKDGTVLPWETDSDTITARSDRVAFLRLRSFCFDLRVRREEEGTAIMTDPELGRVYRTNLVSTLRRAMIGRADTDPPVGEYGLVAVLVAGQNMKTNPSANVLICGRRNGDVDAELVRLDALEMRFETLEIYMPEKESHKGLLKGVITGVYEKDVNIPVEMREVDIY